ncbi:bifunctional DNA primase/polymerase, partial [Rhizobium ruizarguesonis]|uniref:bifunctional DNA primase/polymerase n=1 Tax=Rhizobium ruizarguesonis TaxID=2081791 RepID=UPI0034DB1578
MGAMPPQDADVKTWTGYARSLASIGLPVMLIAPGTKQPLDMRTDKERAAGGRGGVHLATTDPATLKKYVERALADTPKKGHPAPVDGPLNWAVRVAHSGYVVADADTPEEVDARRTFLADQ